MAISKPKKSQDEAQLLVSDVASFAASLGLASSLPSSGFDDSDFRKTGPIKPNNPPKKPNPNDVRKPEKREKFKNAKKNSNEERPKPSKIQFPQLSVDNSSAFDKFKNLPKLPLTKASSLGVWYVDAAELEELLIGGDAAKKKVEIKNVEEWKGLVAKKKELAERLMAQYAQDYESTRGQSRDIKMLINTQRSGTATDKVSAFSVMVGDNPIANIKSLDALLGSFLL